jgi:hypothetical protein
MNKVVEYRRGNKKWTIQRNGQPRAQQTKKKKPKTRHNMLDITMWFSPGTPTSSTTKTGRHDIAEILLKVALNTINQSINHVVIKGTFYEQYF